MLDDLSVRCGDEMFESGVYSYLSACFSFYGFGFRVDEETEIPSRSSLEDATTFDLPFGDIHLVKSDSSESGDADLVLLRRLDRIGERDRAELVSRPLKTRFLSGLLEALRPSVMCLEDSSLKNVGRNTYLFTVPR